ncbi:stringent starvation protein B [Sinobacterium caligoides]|uniref:Stringent starvation protein B n=1 Tax=Sinobacterium caligoides TaxID=933926 RepID=A0A3N2E1X8_9GAMM|nr:ClpXP protease specificity-enhancing factor [Sinobacterium caligoides]ROS06094.1 stringent starvation protein B [Sinobacterium caligoides]
MTMTSRRPYILRATYDWILDNDCTPYIIVDALLRDVVVPEQFIQDGRIVLNIAPGAVRSLEIEGEYLSFNARFAGTPMDVFVPFYALLGIYAKENGEGTLFEAEDPPPEPPAPTEPPVKSGRPSLRVVK